MRRVVLCSTSDKDDIVFAIKYRNIEVAALIMTESNLIDSYPAKRFFEEDFSETSAPKYLKDSFRHYFQEYADLISRVSFFGKSKRLNSTDLVASPAIDEIKDWFAIHINECYWILTNYHSDQVWFMSPPHLGVDNVLYRMAQLMGIGTIIFQQSIFPGKFFYYSHPRELIERQSSLCFRKNLITKNSAMPNLFYMKQKRTSLVRELCDPLRVLRVFGKLIKDYSNGYGELVAFAKRTNKLWLLWVLERPYKLSRITHQYREYRRDLMRNERGNLSLYDLDHLKDPYIYFPLHLQPEATTSALGDGYENQIDAIEELHEKLPCDWRLVVKENPKQDYMYRGKAFYLRCRKLSKLVWADDTVSSDVLIRQSEFVATISGTAGYEALLQGKACVYFGHSWYGSLPGAYKFDREMDLVSLAGERVQWSRLRDSLENLLYSAADGVVSPEYYTLLNSDNSQEWINKTADSLARISCAFEEDILGERVGIRSKNVRYS